MTGRPEVLFPLFASLESLDGLGPKTARRFEQASFATLRDLLFTLPQSGIDRSPRDTLQGTPPGTVVTVPITVLSHVPARQRGRPHRVLVRDTVQEFFLIYFQAHAEYLKKQLPVGEQRLISGRVDLYDGVYQMAHPDHVVGLGEAQGIPRFEPVYPLSGGLTQKLMQRAAGGALTAAQALGDEVPEWIDPHLLAQREWPAWAAAMTAAHQPRAMPDLAASAPARARLAYDEILAHQLTLALARQSQRRQPGVATLGDGRLVGAMLRGLPYQPTGAQQRAIAEISADMASPRRMNRLLQGDVGSGKTLVALAALLSAVEAGGQGVLMAPTEILARQHLESLEQLLADLRITVAVLTGRDKGKEREGKLTALRDGAIKILVGTHAVFQNDVEFQDLRLAVIDEQHRFGVAQRMALGAKGTRTDVLVMTATPIPRSLALAQYGDMDVSVLDEKPPGRTPVKTSLASTERMDEIIGHLSQAMAQGRQAYWVCPLVEESEVSTLTAAQSRFESLRARLGEGVVGLVHGQMPPRDKDAAMAAFVAGQTRVLVATTVIEVGVNVPNASIMVIEGADTFGLAQLHQLRGRVGRGAAVSTCLLLYDPPLSEGGARRLKLMRDTDDGFRISEEDLAMRGAGDVIGTAQSGLPRFRIADLERQSDLMQIAQSDARALLTADPTLSSPRGKAARILLWLMEQDRAIKLLSVG